MNRPEICHEPLVYEYRGDILDNVHMGCLALVDEAGKVVFSVGDPRSVVYMRSSAKPIQALPVIQRRLDEAYGLTPEESTIFAASHSGQPHLIAALESIFAKTGFSESDLIMKPTVPADPDAAFAQRSAGDPPRKFNHNCAGKHAGILLFQRALGGAIADYWKPEAAAQREILRAVSIVSETDPERIGIGVDGCGVPVFGIPVASFATAFRNLAAPDRIRDGSLAEAASRFVPRMHQYPYMISGYGRFCTLLNGDPNLVAKGGAAGVYGLGLKRQRMGLAFKMTSGSSKVWGHVIRQVLTDLDAADEATIRGLEALDPVELRNDNDRVVGEFRTAFEISA